MAEEAWGNVPMTVFTPLTATMVLCEADTHFCMHEQGGRSQ